MFCIDQTEIEGILRDYGLQSAVEQITELQRYDFEWKGPQAKEVRLILKIALKDGVVLVMRLKKESDVTWKLMEEQSVFADALRKNGIETPRQYTSKGQFANMYEIDGYTVIVAVEQFVENEVKEVAVSTAGEMGSLLARMHNIAEREDLHVQGSVLFDPFTGNDLFDFDSVKALENELHGEEKMLLDRIFETYTIYMDKLKSVKQARRYAVQGDISECNLYYADSGELGVFDYNRCGDNNLFCDAVMQAVFVSRLMVYPENREENFEQKILTSFLAGYQSLRAFSEEERALYPYLYAVIDAFWSSDIRWDENSLLKVHEKNDRDGVRRWLLEILRRLSVPME